MWNGEEIDQVQRFVRRQIFASGVCFLIQGNQLISSFLLFLILNNSDATQLPLKFGVPTPGSRAGLEPRNGGKSVAVQPIAKAYQASTADVAGHGQQPELENHQASLGKRWIAEICEGALYEYLAATQLARLLVSRQLNWPRPQIPL
ncbi:hypothetical protein [Bacterioplanoides pacificum]|uniref:Uncharacterized protein n=1 Tax=Bacterioplanoides pacificum TaxID=1171596 RepID=A0ABV7VSQ9_9GAMM